MRRRCPPAIAVGLTAALALAGCAGDDDGTRNDRQPETTDSPTAAVIDDSGGYVDVGDYDVFVRCWGEPVDGAPTVMLVSGATLTIDSWFPMSFDASEEGRHVCAYDRAGVGNSYPPVEEERDLTDQVAELEAVLDGVRLNQPVVLVAHSAGVFPVIGLADAAPERIAGVVLVDAQPPRLNTAQIAALPPERPGESESVRSERAFLEDFLTDPSRNPERLLEIRKDEQAIAILDRRGPVFGDLPLIVLQAPLPARPAGLPDRYHEATVAAINEGHVELAAESTIGVHRKVEDTGHSIQTDQPEVVLEAIADVLAG